MPGWDEILSEILQAGTDANGDFDAKVVHDTRKNYIAAFQKMTGRAAIFYYSGFLETGRGVVELHDMQGLMVVFKDLGNSDQLDLVIHSPGGSPEATDSIVKYIRKKFKHVRVYVPLVAMSAATMLALSGDEIVMGCHSQLGPIDPQLSLGGGESYSVRAIIKQFRQAVEETSANPNAILAWSPILQKIGIGLLQECERAEKLAKSLVRTWLKEYMFKDLDPTVKGRQLKKVVQFFSNYGAQQSHGLGIDRVQAREVGLTVSDLEQDNDLQDALLSAHHACLLTLGLCNYNKLIANHSGKTFISD